MSNIPEDIFFEEPTQNTTETRNTTEIRNTTETQNTNLPREGERSILNVCSHLIDSYNENIRRYNNNIEDSIYYNHHTNIYNQNINTYNTNISQLIQLLQSQISNTNSSSRNISTPFHIIFPDNDMIHRNRNSIFNSPTTFSGLTPFQISEATEDSRYANLPNEEVQLCPISLEEFIEGEDVAKIRGCGHLFKKTSLHRWLLRSTQCPVCRFNIQQENTNEFNVPITRDINELLRRYLS
jgi:hypothetical protein